MARARRGISIRRVWTLSTISLFSVTLVVAVALRMQTIRIMATVEAEDDQADQVRLNIEERLNAMVNQEAGLRGFLATGDEVFLEPYDQGRRDEARVRHALVLDRLHVEDRDELQQALALEERVAQRWQDEIAMRQIFARLADASVDVRSMLVEGRLRFDDYRAAHGTLRNALDRVRANCERRSRAQMSRSNLIAGGLLALLVLVGAVVSRAIVRRTITPLVALAEVAEKGEVTVGAVGDSNLREVLVLARTLEGLFKSVQDRAMRDGLTRAYNRGFLAEWLPRQLRLTRRNGQPLAALMVDLDHFKRINDTLGHAAGDQVLVALARCIERQLRASDVVVRYGGEEFSVFLPDTPVAGACVTAERLRAAIAAMTERDGLPAGLRITASIGLAAIGKGDDGSQLLPRADAALYTAKRSGRNRVVAAALEPRPLKLVEPEKLAS